MIFLPTTNDKIQVVTASAVSSIYMVSSYGDVNIGAATESYGKLQVNVTTATTTDLVAPPASGHIIKLKFMSIRNGHASSSNLITIQCYDGSITTPLYSHTLLAGEQLQYVEGVGFYLIDSTGTSGLYLGLTVISYPTTSFTTSVQTNTIKVRLVGAGGAGGGCTGNATQAAVAGGGGAGGYAEKVFAVSPATAYTCAVGQGGTGVSNATGNNGGNTTFTVGATTVTAFGGSGGVGGVTQTNTTPHFSNGGVGGVVSTNADINTGGMDGLAGIRPQGTAAIATGSYGSGGGGTSRLGDGASAISAHGTGNAASTGYGGGGGGSLSNNTAATTGGAGANGVIIVEEYS